MALGAVQSGYAQTTYAYRKTVSLTEEFYSNISSAAQKVEGGCKNDGKLIGLTMIPYGNTNVSYGMTAQYAAESTSDNPVIQVNSNYGGERVTYKVNVNEVDARNASQLEMFALLSYSDDAGISDGGSFGSYHRMKVYADNAQINGYWEGNDSWEDFLNAKHDWFDIISRIIGDYSKAGVYSQYVNAQKLLGTLSHFGVPRTDSDAAKTVSDVANADSDNIKTDTGTSSSAVGTDKTADKADAADFMDFIHKRMEEIFAMIKNGGSDMSFQIGSNSFTMKEWEEFLKNFDDAEDAMRELMQEKFEEQKEEDEEKKIDALTAECTKCTYPNSTPGKEDTTYITWYTKEGIFCRKAGPSEGYEWSLRFENKEDYDRVMEYVGGLDKSDNLRFAANINFWMNFLKNK